MLSYINSYDIKNIIDNEINLFKNYIDKIILIEENIIILEKYLKLLEIILNQQNSNLNYTDWLLFIESIFLHIDFINNINKKYRLNNMNKLIEGLSKKAADINIELNNLLNKEILATILILKENQEILETTHKNLLFSKKMIQRLLLSI